MNMHAVANAVEGYPGKPKNGGSQPRFYHFDDGVTRLVKWHPSRHGAKACYNELVASRLGQLIGAPILRGSVVYVADEIIPEDHRNDGALPGFHFGITQMEGENFVPAQHYTEIENHSELPMAAAFLARLAVGDQEGHNQYLQRLEIRHPSGHTEKTKLFRLIDMGQMFGNFKWDANSVSAVHKKYKLPQHLAEKLTWELLEPAIGALNTINDELVAACFNDCPDEWDIPKGDVDAAVERTVKAGGLIEQIIRDGNPSLK